MANKLQNYFQEFIEVRLMHGWRAKNSNSSKKHILNVYRRLISNFLVSGMFIHV
jgi:hypothetical protein